MDGKNKKERVESSKIAKFEASGIRDCAIIIRRGARKMSIARRNITQYPPLNRGKLALTPLQISKK